MDDFEKWHAFNDHLQGSAVPSVRWTVPSEVEVRDGLVIWDDSSTGSTLTELPPEAGWRFLRLAALDGPKLERAVNSLASAYGPLRLCETHRLPETHARVSTVWGGREDGSAGAGGCRVASSEEPSAQEPVSGWKELSTQCVAMLLTRAELSEKVVVGRERFEQIAQALPRGLVPPMVNPPEIPDGFTRVDLDADPERHGTVGPISVTARLTAEASVAVAMRHLLAIGDPRPTVEVINGEFTVTIACDSLFGAIALWVATDLHRAQPLVPCRSCGRWYRRSRIGVWCCGDPECQRARRAANKRRERESRRDAAEDADDTLSAACSNKA